MGFGIRVAPGVRISASSRGIRAGIGPRAARIHVGSGRTGFSTGVGPFTYYTSGGGRRRSAGPSRTSIAAYEREVRRAQREEEIAAVHRLEEQLASAHLNTFPPAQRAEAEPAEPVDRRALVKQHRKEQRASVPFFKWAERRAARARAAELAEQAAVVEEQRRADEQQATQRALDDAWDELNANDPATVLEALEAAFADNEAPAAAVDCEGDQVTVVMLQDSPDLVPERKPALTPSGKPTLKKRTKSERNELYVSNLASHVLATVKETFAVAPGLGSVVVLVVRRETSAGLTGDRMVALFCGRFARQLLDGVDWPNVDLARVLDEVPGALIKRKGQAGELQSLDLTSEPDVAEVLRLTHQAIAQPAAA